jgi:hypothetical protein
MTSADLSGGKVRSLALLVVAEVLAMALWFMTAAILPQLSAEAGLDTAGRAWLSSAVQAGFALTTATVQLAPLVAERIGWALLLALLALGPAIGIWAMRPLLAREVTAAP